MGIKVIRPKARYIVADFVTRIKIIERYREVWHGPVGRRVVWIYEEAAELQRDYPPPFAGIYCILHRRVGFREVHNCKSIPVVKLSGMGGQPVTLSGVIL